MLTTNTGSETFVIGDYTPKSQSEEFVQSRRILSELRNKMHQSAEQNANDLQALKKLMRKDEEVKKEISQEIRATVPKDTVPGSVGDFLYGCVRSEVNGKLMACTPECISGPPLTGKSACQIPVYMKTSKGLLKMNDVSGSQANVYSAEKFSTLSNEEEETLRYQGVSDVTVYERESGTMRYRSVGKLSLTSSDSSAQGFVSETRSTSEASESSKCKKSVSWSADTKDCEKKKSVSKSSKSAVPTESGSQSSTQYTSQSSDCPEKRACAAPKSNMGFIMAIVVVIVVLLFLVLAFWWFGATNPSHGKSKPMVTMQTTHIVSEPLTWP